MSKHTPGPWMVSVDGIISSKTRIVAFQRHHGEPETSANGHLLAAAPELLDACKFMVIILEASCKCGDYDCHSCRARDSAEGAIEQAEGR